MGMDLTLYPYNRPINTWTSQVGEAALRLDRHYELFAQIDQKVMGDQFNVKQICQPKSLPANVEFMYFDDEKGVKVTREDKYGNGLTYVEAGELKKLDLADSEIWTKAIFALIKALPDSYPVILMWC